MKKVSVFILAYNDVEKVSATIKSVSWADEVVVIDSWSTDGTTEIAKELGANVVQVEFTGFGELRNKAIQHCQYEWIFSLDSDERCTPEAAKEIRAIVQDCNALDVYWTPRRNYFMGRWIKYSGWYPNYRQPQLFRRGCMSYDFSPVHEGYILNSKKPIGFMKNAIWQFPFKDMAQILSKANRYSTLGASKINSDKISMWTALVHGSWSFIKHYFLKRGFMDGWPGFVIAFGNFEGTFYRYLKALEMKNGDKWREPR